MAYVEIRGKEMKLNKNRILIISICVVTVAAIFIWYFFPVLAGKWFIYRNSSVLNELNMRPSKIENLPGSPSDEWDNISIDTLSLSLPMYRFKKIRVRVFRSTGIGLISDQGSVLLPSLVPSDELLKIFEENSIKYPLIPYEDLLNELNTIPDDISFFNSRSENKTAFYNLTLKRMVIPAYGLNEFLAVNSSNLKAICITNDTGKNGFYATLILNNQTENMSFNIMLQGYKNPDMLKSDILNILGSIKMSEEPLDAEQVKLDIESISRQYNPK
jgi:hypothetical protein